MPTRIVIHGHFYQPPRENPWTNIIDDEPSAAPYPNWNERIHHECYRSNAFARIVDGSGRVVRILNNYAKISFNFGPTLISWIERHHPRTYARILAADRESAAARGGHGNAIAQAYNHSILPLCNERDLLTQVRWGIADFASRFGRMPESLWLPETACNDRTLGALIEHGMKYVILAPSQAARVRKMGEESWKSVSGGAVDPGVPYRYLHKDGSGRSIALFFYDGAIARSIAFEGALASSEVLLERFLRARGGEGRLVHAATDGESYGHHGAHGDRTLNYALATLAPSRGIEVTNYGEFLEQHAPAMEAEIETGPGGKGTSWSCAHGIGRWQRDCGCSTGAQPGWNQAWRTPLRKALDLLRDAATTPFEDAGDLFADPWAARDAYIELLLDGRRDKDEWLRRFTRRRLSDRDKVKALTLLEMQTAALHMYTSCGFFFADISGIETIQIMKYAGRVLDHMEELDMDAPREAFLEILAEARSNLPEMGHGADVYRKFVEPLRVSPRRVAAHIAMSYLAGDGQHEGEAAGYRFLREEVRRQQHERLTLVTARLSLSAIATDRSYDCAVAAIHYGGTGFYCVVASYPGTPLFRASVERLSAALGTVSLPALFRIAWQELGSDEYGLSHLLPEGRAKVFEMVMGDVIHRLSDQYARIYEENQPVIAMLEDLGFALPVALRAAAELTLGRRFEEEVRGAHRSGDPDAYREAIAIADEVIRRGYRIDRASANQSFAEMIAEAVGAAVADPSAEHLGSVEALFSLTRKLRVEPALDAVQELVYDAVRTQPALRAELAPLGTWLWLSPEIFHDAHWGAGED
jgi:alpha-amylase/alpha-mannosidase (GH57 family)